MQTNMKPWLDDQRRSDEARVSVSPRPAGSELLPCNPLRNSYGFQVASRRRVTETGELDPELKAIVDSGIEHRRAIVINYSRLDSALSDLLRVASSLPEYSDVEDTSYLPDRFAVLRHVVAREGPLASSQRVIGNVINGYAQFGDSIEAVVHGFVKVREARRGEVQFCFELQPHRRRKMRRQLTPSDLKMQHTRFDQFADGALKVIADICRDIGPPGHGSRSN